MVALNIGPRIYEVLKEVVKQDLSIASAQEESTSAQLNQGEGVFEIKTTGIKVDPDTGKIIKEDLSE